MMEQKTVYIVILILLAVVINSRTVNSSQRIDYVEVYPTQLLENRDVFELSDPSLPGVHYELVDSMSCPRDTFAINETTRTLRLAQNITFDGMTPHCISNGTVQRIVLEYFSCFVIVNEDMLSFGHVIEIYIIPVDDLSIIETLPITGNVLLNTGHALVHTNASLIATEDLSMLQYSIKSGNTNDAFNIFNNMDGCYSYPQLVTAAPLQYNDASPTFDVIIEGRHGSTTANINVTIELISYNNNVPHVMNVITSIYINQLIPFGVKLLQIHSTDNDIGPGGTLRYTLSSSSSSFSINPISGDIYLIGTPLDYSSLNNTALSIDVYDLGYPMLSSGVTLMVFTTESNEPLHVNITTFYDQLSELASVGTIVAKVIATDRNSSNVSFNLKPSCGNICFTISDITHTSELHYYTWSFDIVVANKLDYENFMLGYLLTVVAEDSSGVITHESVTISMIDENEPPYFYNGNYFEVSVTEKAPVGTQIILLEATDEDGGIEGQLVYSIISGNDNNWFNIDTNTGLVTIANTITLTASKPRNVSLNISVEDVTTTPLSNHAIVNIAIIDIDDHIPSFSKDFYQQTVPESWDISIPIFSFQASDDDRGCSGASRYTILNAQPPNFRIEQTSGLLYAINSLDYELHPTYNVTVQVQSLGNNLALPSQTTLYIVITDVNDNKPVIDPISCPCYLIEEQLEVQHCYPLTARDEDANSQLSFMISSGNDANLFTIDADTGIISTSATLDREIQSAYFLTVVASDGTNLSDNVTMNVIVTDINDKPPLYTGPIVLNVPQDTQIGHEVGSISAFHNDVGYNGLTLYQITSNTPSNVTETFTLDPSSGKLYLNTLLTIGSVYYFSVTAIDRIINSQSSQTSVTITVSGNANIPPQFLLSYDERRISRNLPVNSTVATIPAMDVDNVQYSIVNGSDVFAIDTATGTITTKTGLLTIPTYSIILNISAADDGTPSLTSYASVKIVIYSSTISVSGTVFTQNQGIGVCAHIGNVTEGLNEEMTVVSLPSTQSGLSITYTITSGQFASSFIVSGHQLKIRSGQSSILDRSITEAMFVTLRAVYGTLFHYCSVTIIIDDINNNPPIFPQSTYATEIYTNTPIGSVIYQMQSEDADIGSNSLTLYSLVTPSASFTVHSSTGLIRTSTSSLSSGIYSLFLLARDASISSLNSTMTLMVTVLETTNQPPSIAHPSIQLMLNETHMVNSIISNISASDIDDGSQGHLHYCIQYGNYNNQFTTGTNGQLILTSNLDYDTQLRSNNISIMVYDASPNVQWSQATVHITINDVNDEYPIFLTDNYLGNVMELSPIDTPIISVAAIDKDTNDFVTYSLSPPDSRFNINSTTGQLTVASSITRETAPEISLIALANDQGGHVSSVNITIAVFDDNDHRPVFETPNGQTISLPESTVTDTVIFQVKASDQDRGMNALIHYWITSGNTNGTFLLDSASGNITLSRLVDYETDPHSYNLLIGVTDRGVPVALSGTTLLSVAFHITNINDNRPLFTEEVYYCTISLLTELRMDNDGISCQVKAVDHDITGNNVTYSIIDGTSFTIDSSSGVIINSTTPNFETTSKYYLTVRAVDGGSPPHSSTALVVITVEYSRSQKTLLFDEHSTIVVPQYLPPNTLLFYAHVTNTNSKDPPVTYNLLSNGESFQLDSQSGAVSTITSLNVTMIHTLNVLADLNGVGNARTFHINVHQVNRNSIPPQFTADNVPLISVLDTASIGQYVTSIIAIDLDTNSDVSYFIASGSGYGYFAINSSNGTISVNYPLTALAFKKFTLMIMAVDSEPLPLSAFYNLTIVISPFRKPFFDKAVYQFAVDQSKSFSNTIVGHVRAAVNNQTSVDVRYELSSANSLPFAINSTTGAVVAIDAIEHNEYTFTVMAHHIDAENITTTALVIIHISDNVNDFRPVFPDDFNQFAIPSNLPVNSTITRMFVTDNDYGINAISTFSISPTNTPFRIEPTTGEIRLASAPVPSPTLYNVTVTAHNNDLITLHQVTLTIYVPTNNSGSPTPFFAETNGTVTWAEITPIGTLLYTVPHVSNGNTVFFTIDRTRPQMNPFTIHPNTGKIYLIQPLDYEVQSNHILVVNVWDGVNNSENFTLILTVSDNDDNRPYFMKAEFDYTINENALPNTTIGTMRLIDNDTLTTELMYYEVVDSLHTVDHQLFNISNEGVLTVIGTLDREQFISHTLTVAVQTPHKFLNFVRVIVYLTDEDDNIPQFTLTHVSNLVIPENNLIGHFVAVVNAFDPDEGESGTINYALNNDVPFNIDSTTGHIITSHTLDYEQTQTYTLTVTAYNPHQNPSNYSTSFTVSVFDVIDTYPNVSTINSAMIYENQPPLTLVANLGLGETPHPVTYSIINGNEENQFLVEPFTGIVRTSQMLDREFIDSYNLTIRCFFSKEFYTDASVFITVLDVNDNNPHFDSSNTFFSVPENAQISDTILDLLITDNDVGVNQLINSVLILDPVTDEIFTIESNGTVKLKQTLDRETKNMYQFRVAVIDSSMTNPLHTIQVITIQVSDVNDNSPIFTQSSYTFTVSLPSFPNETLFNIKATDIDEGEYGQIASYDIAGGSGTSVFSIDHMTGSVTLVKRLDLVSEYSLVISATDGGGRTTSVNVHVILKECRFNSLTFQPSYYNVSLPEDASVDSQIVHLNINDFNQSGIFVYSIISSSNYFHVNSTTGLVRLVQPLDRETENNYTFVVQVQDVSSSALRIAEGQLTVIVTDINDNAPSFINTPYAQFVLDTAPAGTVIFQVASTDIDSGVNSQITYSILDDLSAFSIDSTTGNISLKQSLDLSLFDRHLELYIIAQDEGNPPLSSNTTLRVTILDSNAPTFSQPLYAGSISEAVSDGFIVLTVTAIPHSQNPLLFYSITENVPDPRFPFSINPNNGIITVNDRGVDYERKNFYPFYVKAEDIRNSYSSEVQVEISISDFNDEIPTFSEPVYIVNVAESTHINTTILTVSATDLDTPSNAQLMYHLSSSTVFMIDPVTGQVQTLETLDYENQTNYQLTVSAIDSGLPPLTGSSTIRIIVTNINDNAPVFTTSPILTVSETAEPGTLLTYISATDKDNDELIFALVDSTGSDNFTLSSDGLLRLNSVGISLTQVSYSLLISANDSIHVIYTNITVNIQDVNNHSPVFNQPSYHVNVLENSPQGTSVLQVTATDDDRGINAEISYSTHNSDFAINSTTGLISTNALIDRERTSLYELVIVARDGGNRIGATTVYITIDDINDNRPIFVQSSYAAFVPEGTYSFHSRRDVLTVRATDADNGLNASISYSIINSTGKFDINANTGLITAIDGLDYEERNSHNVSVVATDGGGLISDIAMVTVNVIDVADTNPSFSQNDYYGSVPEHSSRDTEVLATNVSFPSQCQLTGYSIFGSASIPFKIDSNGVVRVNGDLDRESTDSYDFTVIVECLSTLSMPFMPFFDSTMIHVTITDINESPTSSVKFITPTISEASPINTTIDAVVVTDNDLGINGTIRYRLDSGDMPVSFAIDPVNGTIYVHEELDRETKDVHTFRVIAYDLGIPISYSVSIYTVVSITDVNDSPPNFHCLSDVFINETCVFNVSIPENTPTGTSIITMATEDLDLVGDVTFQSSNLLFNVTPSGKDGIVQTTGSLDRELTDIYYLQVLANDGVFTATAILVINITDVNDNAPLFSTDSFHVTVNENYPVDVVFMIANATDADEGVNAIITYSILSSPVSNNISMNSTNGEIHFSVKPDYETSDRLDFNIRANDIDDMEDIATLRIDIIDLNDNYPVFTMPSYEASIYENRSNGTDLMYVSATDADSGSNGLISYSLDEISLEYFQIDTTTGLITSRKIIDRERNSSFLITVVASDNGDSILKTEAVVNVTVIDINDNAPMFSSNIIIANITEAATNGTIVDSLGVVDLDVGSNSMLIFDISGDNSEDFYHEFTPDGQLTIRVSKNLNHERISTYNLILSAIDGGIPALTSSVQLIVNVLDENDNMPHFTQSLYPISIPENMPVNASVITVEATDLDSSDANLIYSFTDPVYDFAIHPLSGIVTVLRPLDFENITRYDLRVKASEPRPNPQTAHTIIEITITDVNDNPPEFLCPNDAINLCPRQTLNITENQPPQVIANLTVRDLDTVTNLDAISFSIDNPPQVKGQPAFAVDPLSGQLSVLTPLDREENDIYTIEIKATDDGVPTPLVGTAFITIMVIDLNDNIPQGGNQSIFINLLAGQWLLSGLSKVLIYDDDIVNQHVYSIYSDNSDGLFTVHRLTGDINSITDVLAPSRYLLYVSITDTLYNGSVYTTYTTISIDASNITTETQDNSFNMVVYSMTPDIFIRNYLNNFNATVNSILSRYFLNYSKVDVISIKTSEFTSNSTEITLAGSLTNYNYINPDLFQHTLRTNKQHFVTDTGIDKYTEEVNPCHTEPCTVDTVCNSNRIFSLMNTSTSYIDILYYGLNMQWEVHCLLPQNTCKDIQCPLNSSCVEVKGQARCVDDCQPSPCKQNGQCIRQMPGYYCLCPEGYDGPNCELTSATFNDNSLVIFPSVSLVSRGLISFEIITDDNEGLIMYTGTFNDDSFSDYVMMFISNNTLQCHLSMGNYTYRLQIDNILISTRLWHYVYLHYSTDGITLSVKRYDEGYLYEDSHVSIETSDHHFLDTTTPLMIGNLPQGYHADSLGMSFSGCLRNIVINDNYLDFTTALMKENLTTNCFHTDRNCYDKPCNNSGQCTGQWSSFQCTCIQGYTGNTCDDRSQSVSFTGTNYIQYDIILGK
jgi:hypothetical protein